MEDFIMMELRRLKKTVKKYLYYFQNEPEEFRDHIDLYIDDLKNLINYTNDFISSTQEELEKLYTANIDLFSLNPAFVLKPFVFILMRIMEKMMDNRSKHIFIVRRYNKFFKNSLERLESMKYLCDL